VWQAKTLDPDSQALAAAPPELPPASGAAAGSQEADPRAPARRAMVEDQLRARDITDRKVLEVMGRVPRHRFVPDDLQRRAYEDRPLPIGHGQTISQPYIVALMTQLVAPKPGDRALDIGTGSGYQAAVLAELCKEVYGIEIVEPLADESKKRLAGLGYKNVTLRCGDGYRGWKEHAPFDVIVVAASPDHVPQPLIDQLAPGGRLVIPVGGYPQQLTLLTRQPDGKVVRKRVAPVMFVPMTGEAQQRKE
jgi:protein-L-isoaspartate(D-aspartate) O-methyltransferase